MNTAMILLLTALMIIGIGLFVRAWTRGMQFGERLEERQRADRERRSARQSDLCKEGH
jgi:hypothetical protein